MGWCGSLALHTLGEKNGLSSIFPSPCESVASLLYSGVPVRVWGRRAITRARDASLRAPTPLRQTITTALWTQSDKATLLSFFFPLVLFLFFYPFPCLTLPDLSTSLSQQYKIHEFLTGASACHLGVRSPRSLFHSFIGGWKEPQFMASRISYVC